MKSVSAEHVNPTVTRVLHK